MANSAVRAATAAPAPVDEPPVNRSVFQGLRGWGYGRSWSTDPIVVPNSQVFSLPSRIAPAARSRVTIVASKFGTWSIRTREFTQVRIPRVK